MVLQCQGPTSVITRAQTGLLPSKHVHFPASRHRLLIAGPDQVSDLLRFRVFAAHQHTRAYGTASPPAPPLCVGPGRARRAGPWALPVPGTRVTRPADSDSPAKPRRRRAAAAAGGDAPRPPPGCPRAHPARIARRPANGMAWVNEPQRSVRF